jgi:hypothetical protein
MQVRLFPSPPILVCVPVLVHPWIAPPFAPPVLAPHRHRSVGKSKKGKPSLFSLSTALVYAHIGHVNAGRHRTTWGQAPLLSCPTSPTCTQGGMQEGFPLPLLTPPLPLTCKWAHKRRTMRSDKPPVLSRPPRLRSDRGCSPPSPSYTPTPSHTQGNAQGTPHPFSSLLPPLTLSTLTRTPCAHGSQGGGGTINTLSRCCHLPSPTPG